MDLNMIAHAGMQTWKQIPKSVKTIWGIIAASALTACGWGGGGGGTPGSKPEFNSSDPTSFALTLWTPEALCVQPWKPDGATITFVNLPNGMTYNPGTNCLVVSSNVIWNVKGQVYKFTQQATNTVWTAIRELTMSVNSSPIGTPTSKQIEPRKTTVVSLLEWIIDPEVDMLNVKIVSKSFQWTTGASCTDSCTIEDLFWSIVLDQNDNLSLTPKESTQWVLKIIYTAEDGRGGKKEFTKLIQVVDSSQITAGLVDTNFSSTDTNPTISPFIIGNTDVISVTAVWLPNGITIDPNTREIKGTFIPKNPNGRTETYKVDFNFQLSSGAVLKKTVTWNFPTYFAASPLNLNTITIGNNTVIHLTPGTETPLSKVTIDTAGLWFVPSGMITVTTTQDQPTPGATVSIVNWKIVVTARSWAWSISPIVHTNWKTIQINGMKG
jgi:Putative Ig domain